MCSFKNVWHLDSVGYYYLLPIIAYDYNIICLDMCRVFSMYLWAAFVWCCFVLLCVNCVWIWSPMDQLFTVTGLQTGTSSWKVGCQLKMLSNKIRLSSPLPLPASASNKWKPYSSWSVTKTKIGNRHQNQTCFHQCNFRSILKYRIRKGLWKRQNSKSVLLSFLPSNFAKKKMYVHLRWFLPFSKKI